MGAWWVFDIWNYFDFSQRVKVWAGSREDAERHIEKVNEYPVKKIECRGGYTYNHPSTVSDPINSWLNTIPIM